MEKKDMKILCLNDGNCGVTKHRSLLTHMDACVDMGDILGTSEEPVGHTILSQFSTNILSTRKLNT